MSLKLFYITNQPAVAMIAQEAGVDRLFLDMEHIGKAQRQGGLDTVQSHHSIDDIKTIRKIATTSELLVRCNPIHNATGEYSASEEEIDAIVAAGADLIMLPYFKTKNEVSRFLQALHGRCRSILLFETPESVALADEILDIPGIDEVFIGLNDLSLGYGRRFMFELLSDGTVEKLCLTFKMRGVPYGFGGIAAIGQGTLPAEAILKEHYRLGSSMVILSRSFCNCSKIIDIDLIRDKFNTGLRIMRAFEAEIAVHSEYFQRNTVIVAECVQKILESK